MSGLLLVLGGVLVLTQVLGGNALERLGVTGQGNGDTRSAEERAIARSPNTDPAGRRGGGFTRGGGRGAGGGGSGSF